MKFSVHPGDRGSSSEFPDFSRAYIRGMDGRVFPTVVEFDGQTLICRRAQTESGKLSVPWQVATHGTLVLTTTSLREREGAYLLPLELARGKLSEIRDQCATWEIAKMAIPDRFTEVQRQAFHHFAHAAANQNAPEVACQEAEIAIKLACDAADLLADAYVIQRMTSIRRTTNRPPGLFGCVLDSEVNTPENTRFFLETFHAASVPVRWVDVEPQEGRYNWGPLDELIDRLSAHTIIRGGPLIDLGVGGLPAWLAPWKNDFLNLPSFVCDFVETAIQKYQSFVRIWEVSAGGNTGGAFDLSEEHRLALVARTLETAIRTDSDSQFFIRIEEPWGEYQRRGEHRLSPYQYVDALIRSNLGLSGISFDLTIGYKSPASMPRDLLSISKLIDYWSILGVQIHVNLACPSSSLSDSCATGHYEVDNSVIERGWSEAHQAEWLERVVPLLLAKPSVTGVFLKQFCDCTPHKYPHSGILRPDGSPKLAVESMLRQLRSDLG